MIRSAHSASRLFLVLAIAFLTFPTLATAQYKVNDSFWGQIPLASINNPNGLDNPATNGSGSNTPTTQLIRANGVSWTALNCARGKYNWTSLDHVVSSYLAGTQFLYTLLHTPSWANTVAGRGAYAVLSLSGTGVEKGIYTNMSSKGTGYTTSGLSLCFVTSDGNGSGAAGTATVSGGVVSITITLPGSGCYVAPTVYVLSSGSNAYATSDVVQSGETCTITNFGQEDCYIKEFFTALMEHECGLSSVPSSPVSTCKVRNVEMWNEFNDTGFWNDTKFNLARMGEDASVVIRKFCNNCKVGAGSTSAGGAGYPGSHGDTNNWGDPNLPVPGSTNYYQTYDYDEDQILGQWKADITNGAVSGLALPDFVSWHPYPTYEYTTYTPASGSAYYVPVDPEPFPETASSGSGAGTDLGTGTTATHTGSVICASATDEYSLSFTDSNANNSGKHYAVCGDAIAGTGPSDTTSQIYKIQHIATKYGIPEIWATEGGFYNLYNLQGSDDKIPESTSMTRRNFLRRSYIGRWLITLAGRGVSVAVPYAYDANNNGHECFMPQYVPPLSEFTNIQCGLPDKSSSSQKWGTGYVYNLCAASNNTSTGAGPVGSGGYNGGDGFDDNYNPNDPGSSNGGALISSSGLTAIGQAYNTTFSWINGNKVDCSDNGGTVAAGVYDCFVYNSNGTYIGTIYWDYQWNKVSPSFTPATKGGAFNSKYYVDTTAPGSYSGGTIAVSGEPVFYYHCNVSGAPRCP